MPVYLKITGINGTEIGCKDINGNLAIKKLRINDSIVPADLIWTQDPLIIKSWWMDPFTGNYEIYWHSDDYLALRKNAGDSYHWLGFEFDDFYSTGDVWISGYASWRPCVFPPELGSDTSIYLNESLVLDAGEGYDQYYWTGGEENQIIDFIASEWGVGSHNISLYTSKDSCNYKDSKLIKVLDQSGIFNIPSDYIRLFPVLANDRINLSGELQKNAFVEIFSLQGKIMERLEFNGENIWIDISGYSKGMYLVKYTSNQQSAVLKFIKQ
jgi:hypothetical protein